MNASRRSWRFWILFGDVIVAILLGVVVLAVLNLVSAGFAATVATLAGVYLALGLLHYVFWGHIEDRAVPVGTRTFDYTAEVPDQFVLEIDDSERSELLNVLEQSLSAAPGRDAASAAMRRRLLDKVRSFGA